MSAERRRKAEEESPTKRLYRLRGWVMVPLILFITLCARHECENKLFVWGIGGLTFALGVALRVWAQTHLHYRLKVPKVLTVTGPYAFVRNPIYIANTVILAGACMFAELFWFIPVFVLYCAVVYAFVIRYEEASLLRKYGRAYQEYVALVPRVFPQWRRPQGQAPTVTQYFLPSIVAESHNLIFLLLFAIKEILTR
jgi:protein-S-isoprenylcysteine O-methyltransferase Ste14